MSIDRRRGPICGTHETFTVVSALQCPVCALERAESRIKELEMFGRDSPGGMTTYDRMHEESEGFRRERDEARRALGWYFTFGCIHGPIPKEFDEAITAGFAAYKVSLESVAARAAAQEERR